MVATLIYTFNAPQLNGKFWQRLKLPVNRFKYVSGISVSSTVYADLLFSSTWLLVLVMFDLVI